MDNRWIELKVGEGILFGLSYVAVLISAWFLRKKIPRYVFLCWGGMVSLFLINEIRFALSFSDYNIIESFTKTQGYYTAKFTMPLLFWGVWSKLKDANNFGLIFSAQLQKFLVVNAIFVIIGAVFDVTCLESYPLSGRWGYSGLLWHLSFHCIIYGVFSLYLLAQKKKQWGSIVLFGLVLLLLGQKAGLLYFLLIFTFSVVRNRYLQKGIIASCIVLISTAQVWLSYIVTLSTFWESVYNKHGVWGVVLSRRNGNVQNIWDKVGDKLSVIDIIIGGVVRFPSRVEMMPFDILVYFGILGLLLSALLFFKIIPNLKWGIPLVVAFFGGGIYEAPLGMVIYLIILGLIIQSKGGYNQPLK